MQENMQFWELSDLDSWTNLSSNPNVISLDLSNNNLNSIPDKVFLLSSLQKLDLKNNNIVNVQNEIENLTKLKKLDISNNKLTTIGKSLSKLNLSVLNCSNNPIEFYHIDFCKKYLKVKSYELQFTLL